MSWLTRLFGKKEQKPQILYSDCPDFIEPPSRDESVAIQYALGIKVTEIQRAFNLSPGTMYRILHKQNVPLRTS